MPIPRQPTPEEISALHTRFYQTDEFKLWKEFADAVKDAAHAPTPTVTLPTAFLRIAAVEIEETPFAFAIMTRPWNRVCDELELEAMKMEGPYGRYPTKLNR